MEDDRETAQEKRIRLAKSYIASIATPIPAPALNSQLSGCEPQSVPGEFDAGEVDKEIISRRLRDDALAQQGKLITRIADTLLSPTILLNKKLGVTPTAVCMTSSPMKGSTSGRGGEGRKWIWVSSKGSSILKVCAQTGQVCARIKGIKKPKNKNTTNKNNNNEKDGGERAEKEEGGHWDEVLCLASTSKYLISGGRDHTVCVWDLTSMSADTNEEEEDAASIPRLVHQFKHHRDAVTGLAIKQAPMGHRPLSHSTASTLLYTCSLDRSVKVFSLDEMAYIETLFGHQDRILAMDAIGQKERCLTVGARDRTVRLWKVIEESQLIYRASSGGGRKMKSLPDGLVQMASEVVDSLAVDETGSLDSVCFLDEETWVSGSDGGTLSVWSVGKKKPMGMVPNAHGRLLTYAPDEQQQDEKQKVVMTRENAQMVVEEYGESVELSSGCGISALTSIPYSDVVVSGSNSGEVRLWKVCRESGVMELKQRIEVQGWVNTMHVHDQHYLVVGVGREPRLGRWCQSGRNRLLVIQLF